MQINTCSTIIPAKDESMMETQFLSEHPNSV